MRTLALVLLLVCASACAQVPRDALAWRRTIIAEGRSHWGMQAPTAAFSAQIHQESAWNPAAVSAADARGLAQFTAPTAKWISGAYSALADGDPFNPRWAIRALVIYDKHLFDRIRAESSCERMAFALSAYNGGLGWVNRRKAASDRPEKCFDATCDINPGILPANQRENAAYPRRILIQVEPRYAAAGFGPRVCG